MGFEFGRHPIADNPSRTKHVVAAGWSAWDAGSTPAASTSLRSERSDERRLPRRSNARALRRRARPAFVRSELRLGKPVPLWSKRRTLRRQVVSRQVKGDRVSFHYVYILQSVSEAHHFYVGLTDDLHARLHKHNAGEVPHTAKFRPWRIKIAIAFRDRDRAAAFERYLKSGSGRAFALKHF